ncbi:hypothetical protein BJF83_11945 [Nocardiopsis sp. CNR-923]|uniref:hypothetical protein n=1 Tax=Nocardiopsis sp. CNR-923 TaxID=1904965 RepID=UPI00095FBA17|nr:hypothetical protein [Nocardiopsis sp. CNR-923]OLT29296.1 hypothetical protein BJF83_11945 [Nocardiopsis sp. CNR-923]
MSEEQTAPSRAAGRPGFSPADMPKVRASHGAGSGSPPRRAADTRAAPDQAPDSRARDGGAPPRTAKRARPAPEADPRVNMPVPSAGPLGGLLQTEWGTAAHPYPTLVGPGTAENANALIVLRRTAFVPEGRAGVELPPQAGQALVRWAQDHDLGQVRGDVLDAARRRERALVQLRSQGKHVPVSS